MPKSLKQEIFTEIRSARSLLDDLAQLGLSDVYPVDPQPGTDLTKESHEVLTTTPTLSTVREELGECTRCALSTGRNCLVFGVGNEDADLVFVGEAPGREEDLSGEPFVGEAGKLLDRILSSVGMQRSQVYICNVIKCRPPGNRDPQPDEIATCEPFLRKQLDAIRPRLIVSLGRFAAQTLLQSDVPISRLRGKWQTYQSIPLMPTYHPAFLLRNPMSKRDVWEDMKQVLQRLRHGG